MPHDKKGHVFVKKIRFGDGEASRAEDVFQEIEANIRVRHPNIVEMVDHSVHDGMAVLVFEYMPDGSLSDYLRDVGSVAESDARMIMEQLIDAVIHIHESGVMHGNLKCSNIVRSGNRWALSDFSKSKFISGDGMGATAGTPLYLSPDAIGSPAVKCIDAAASDTRALGVIMFQMLFGHYPLSERGLAGPQSNIVDNNIQFDPEIELLSDGAIDLMGSMLCHDPAYIIKLRDAARHPWISGP